MGKVLSKEAPAKEKKPEPSTADRINGADPMPEREYIKFVATTKNEFQHIYYTSLHNNDRRVELELNLAQVELDQIKVEASTLGNSPEFYFTMISADMTVQGFRKLLKEKMKEISAEATRLQRFL